MARRNQNTFLKRQKEIERVRKAKEKMDRRHGKKSKEEEPFGVAVFGEPSQDPDGVAASGESSQDPDGVAVSDEPSQDADGEGAAETSPDP